MENEKARFCPALWFSGFFGLGAVVHVVRLITGFSVVIGGREIPLEFSGVAVIVFGILSVGLLILSLKRPCETKKEGASVCCK
jgi:hypothetical protein